VTWTFMYGMSLSFFSSACPQGPSSLSLLAFLKGQVLAMGLLLLVVVWGHAWPGVVPVDNNRSHVLESLHRHSRIT
jgi:hypothetical protein